MSLYRKPDYFCNLIMYIFRNKNLLCALWNVPKKHSSLSKFKKNISSNIILLFLKSMYLICFGQNLSRVILNIQVHSTTNYHKKHTSFIANNNDMLNDLITRKLNLSNYYQRFSIVYHCWKHFKKSNNICILFIPQTPFTCGYYIHETSCKIFTINKLPL